MADYCSTSDIKSDLPDSPLSSTTDTTYDTAIGGMITAASRLIDKAVGRNPDWFSSTDSTTRYFDGSGEVYVPIDECHTITAVAVAESGGTEASDYTSWNSSDYYASPYNYADLQCPINGLIVDWNGDKSCFPLFRKAVKVTAQWGYSATPPDDIKQACKIQTMRWFGRAKQLYQDASAGVATGKLIYVQQLDPDVKTLLWPYIVGNSL